MANETPRRGPAPFRDDAPNVVVVVLDDLGFAQLGCYGSDLETPNIDRLAARGVRFSNFHTTAVCSPTRASLLTGRNPHRVGMGMLPDLATNFPGYSGRFPEGVGTLAQVLQRSGYATFCVGKWHLVPRDERATGPYGMWPTSLGFDRYYGFLNGETNQWTPNLVRDTNHVEPPCSPEDGYHLDADLADQAIAYLRELRFAHPHRPFFLWYASAAPHAPHQAPPEWIERFRGRFDGGWDAWRAATLERQHALGIVPPDAQLSERPPWIEPWDEIDPERRRLYARMMEVCAAYIAHADHHLGRLVDHLESTGELDQTIVVFVSDNGASGEGGPNGGYNQLRHYISDVPDDIDDELAHLEDLGGFRSNGHYPWGWALAANTPFRRWKRYTFEGGVRDPMIVVAPGVTEAGGVRGQYCHAVDVAPTVLELCGLEFPDVLDGVPQMSVDGVSLVPVLADPTAGDVRTRQYYECWGSRAVYDDGWKAVTNHVNQLTAAERDEIDGSHDFATDTWALFDVRNDPTEMHDLAKAHPEKLRDLITDWHAAAERDGVFPLDDGRDHRFAHVLAPWSAWQPTFRLRPGDKVHEAVGPNLAGGFRIVAVFTEPFPLDGQVVLCEQGDWSSGWAWFAVDGVLTWCIAGAWRDAVHGRVPPGVRVLVAQGELVGGVMEVSLHADGTEIGRRRLDAAVPLAWSPDGAFLTVGYSRPFPVSEEYTPPAVAPPTLLDVTIDVGQPPPMDLEVEFARIMRHQ
jgi:arylsulfatase